MNQTPDILDVDALIAGFQRATTTVTIFQRPDLASVLDELDEQISILKAEQQNDDGDDRVLGEQSDIEQLTEQRDALMAELEASAVRITLQALETDEVEALAERAQKTAKERADEAAKKAREWARDQARREEVKDPKEINEMLRRAAAEASGAVIRHEVGIHTMAEAMTSPKCTVEQARRLADAMGAPQMQKIQTAFYELTSRDPQATLPKSWRPGSTAEGNALS